MRRRSLDVGLSAVGATTAAAVAPSALSPSAPRQNADQCLNAQRTAMPSIAGFIHSLLSEDMYATGMLEKMDDRYGRSDAG